MTEKQRLKRNETVRKYRKKTGNRATHKYERTKRGFLMRKYRNMQSRVVGIQKKKAHLYKGKCLLEREEYYKWALNSKEFNKLYEEWVKSGYDRKLCPIKIDYALLFSLYIFFEMCNIEAMKEISDGKLTKNLDTHWSKLVKKHL